MTKKLAPQLIHDLKPPIDSINELAAVLADICHSMPENNSPALVLGITKLVEMTETLSAYIQERSDEYGPELIAIKNKKIPSLPDRATIVILDNDTTLTEALRFIAKRHNKKITIYNNYGALQSNLTQYQTDTVFFLDYMLDNTLNGSEIAEKLHTLGYSHLYVMSGYHLTHDDIPPYVTLLTDKKELLNFINKKTS